MLQTAAYFKNFAVSWMHPIIFCYFTLMWDGCPETVLKRAFDLRDELKTVLNQKSKPQFEALFGDKKQLHKIAYLVDIFATLNELNLSLQGPNATCLDLSEKIRAFQLKLQLWPKKLEENDIEQETMNRTILSVKEHLKFLKKKFQDIFLIYLTHHLPLLETNSPSKLCAWECTRGVNWKLIFLQCQLPNFASRVFRHILFCLRSHCPDSSFSNNKMICVVLLQGLLQGYQMWRERSKHSLLTDAFWFSQVELFCS